MKLSFWPLLIGALAIIWGAAKLARYVLGVNFPSIINVYVWSTVAIIIGFWFISRGTQGVLKR
jgi:hypothetical protein